MDDRPIGAPARRLALTVTGLTKTFGGTRAVDDVSFGLEAGTIHALLGGNGSGKSTTIKMLSGMYRADAGAFDLSGERHDATSWTVGKSYAAGLRFVHQQASTFPELTVAENLAIGHGFETGVGGRVRWRAQRQRAQDLLERLGLANIDPRADLAKYGVATHAMIAIARACRTWSSESTVTTPESSFLTSRRQRFPPGRSLCCWTS